MQIQYSLFVELLEKAAGKVVAADDARYFAENTAETEARRSERTDPLKSALADIEACAKHKDSEIEFTVDLPAYIAIDFKSHGPLPHMKQIHDELEKRSEMNGIAMAAFTNSQGMHTLASWVQGLAKRGLVAIAACNGGPAAVVPFNGTRGVFGTNPIAYGFPEKNGEILCVDMATSEIPYFEILDAKKDGVPLRERSAVDQNGEFTTNPDAALDYSESESDPVSNLVSMGGGYKGYNLTFLLELLTSGLIGMLASPQMSDDFVPEEHGSVIIVFNPKALGTKNTLQASIESIRGALESQKPKAGETIRIPGAQGSARLKSRKEVLDIDDTLLEKLRSLA